MTELELCNTLGIILDPDNNKVIVTDNIRESVDHLSQAFWEMEVQKQLLGSVNKDLWLEFIPWHSDN